jgi:arsenic resistance protein ArsH
MAASTNGDINNTAAKRSRVEITADAAYRHVSLAIPLAQDEPLVRSSYRPFLQEHDPPSQDWVSQLELSTALEMVNRQVLQAKGARLRVLVLYGSMRQR